jgi:hypothetical protein
MKRWKSAGMLEAERWFRRVRGCKGTDKLVDVLRRETTPACCHPKRAIRQQLE